MGILDFDMGGVTSAGKPLPEGEYEFVIEDAHVKPAKAGNSHNLVLKLTVVSEVENGRVHTENLNLQEKTKPFVKAFFTKLWGVDDDDVDNISFDVDETDMSVRAVNEQPLVGMNIGGFVKHINDQNDPDKVYANVTTWITV